MGPASRPAEYGGVTGAVAVLIGHIAGINDAGTLAALAVVVGFIPAAITWAVTLVRKKSAAAPPAAAPPGP
jgi:hypothetical protein